MNSSTVVKSVSSSTADARLHGHWLVLARLMSLALGALSVWLTHLVSGKASRHRRRSQEKTVDSSVGSKQ
jgi:hypothetical protein